MSDAAAVAVPPEAKPARNLTLDGLKYVCAALIVLHHVSAIVSGSRIGLFFETSAVTALYGFFAISGFFHGEVGGRGGAWLLNRFKRLAIPYGFWSAVYVVYDELPGVHAAQAFHYWLNPLSVIFLAGAHGILWFLPALLACAVLADLLVRTPALRRAAIAVCLALTVLEVWTRVDAKYFAPWIAVRFEYWALVYLCGMELRAWKWRPKRSPSSRLVLAAATGGVFVALGIAGGGGWRPLAWAPEPSRALSSRSGSSAPC